MFEPLIQSKKKAIIANILLATTDISKLKRIGYEYLSVCSGFTNHKSNNGFKEYYITHNLRDDLLANELSNGWVNFNMTDQFYDYMMSRADVYKKIILAITN